MFDILGWKKKSVYGCNNTQEIEVYIVYVPNLLGSSKKKYSYMKRKKKQSLKLSSCAQQSFLFDAFQKQFQTATMLVKKKNL
jgi:hypothetical protein